MLTTHSFEIGMHSTRGARPSNQDALLTAQDCPHVSAAQRRQYGRLYVVADGVGGADAGGEASHFVATRLLRHYYDDPLGAGEPTESLAQRLLRATYATSQALHALSAERHLTMRSTVVAALLTPGARRGRLDASIVTVGDSPAVLLRPGHAPQRLTTAHVQHVDGRGLLTEAMGNPTITLATITTTLQPGDALLLCTDGVCGPDDRPLDGATIRRLTRRRPASQAAQDLVAHAMRYGSGDNSTALLVRYRVHLWRRILMRVGITLVALAVMLTLIIVARPDLPILRRAAPPVMPIPTAGAPPPQPTISAPAQTHAGRARGAAAGEAPPAAAPEEKRHD